MQRFTDFQVGDIISDWQGKHHYLLLEFVKSNGGFDLFQALLLENGKRSVWGFDNMAFNKVA